MSELDSLLEVKNSTSKTGSQPLSGLAPEGTLPGGQSRYASSLMVRYQNAYTVARFTTGCGGIIKGIGILLAVVLFGGSATLVNAMYGLSTTYGQMPLFAGFLLALIVGGCFFLAGILVSAQGQVLQAALDGTVNSSPFLNNDQKAQVMSLK